MSVSQSGHSEDPHFPPPQNPRKISIGKTVAICVSSVVGAVILGFALFPVVLIGGNSLFWWAVSEKQPYYNIDRALDAIGYDSSMAIEEERTHGSPLAPSVMNASVNPSKVEELHSEIVAYTESTAKGKCYSADDEQTFCVIGGIEISLKPELGNVFELNVLDSNGGRH